MQAITIKVFVAAPQNISGVYITVSQETTTPVLNSGWKVAQSLEQGQNICMAFCSCFQVLTSVNTTKWKVFRKNRHHLPSASSHIRRNLTTCTLYEQRRKYTSRLRILVLSTIYTVGHLRGVLAQGFSLDMFEKASLFTTKIRLPQRSYRWKSKDCAYFYALHHSIFRWLLDASQ